MRALPPAHTPGPWFVEGDNCVSAKIDDGPFVAIAMTNPFNDLPMAEEEANARLIAAAPTLLGAAQKALNYIENTEGELGIKLDSGDALRAAIAKATVDAPETDANPNKDTPRGVG